MDQVENHNSRVVQGAYPYLIAQEIGCEVNKDFSSGDSTYWPIAQNALTTAFVLDLLGLEDNFCDTEYLYNPDTEHNEWEQNALSDRYYTDLAYFGAPESFAFGGKGTYGATGSAGSIRSILNDASLITIQLGMGDVIQRAQILGMKGVDFGNTEQLIAGVAKTVKLMYEGYNYWVKAYPILLKYIKDNNPDSTVVIVSALNPIQNLVISDELLLPIGTALSAITELMNAKYAKWAKEYGHIYVDVTGVEFPADLRNITISEYLAATDATQGQMAHPTPEGYKQMASLILDELIAKEAEQAASKTAIKVELGRFKTVDYVLVDGNKVRNYSMSENGVLTVECGSIYADTLTVAVKDDNGRVKLNSYILSYDGGYTAHKLYTTNDLFGAIGTTLHSIFDIIRGVFSKIFGK